MIPRHRPPFSLLEFVAAQIGSDPFSREGLEARIADHLGIPHVVLLPSARFGIWVGLRTIVPSGQTVAVPVLNCSAVHEAAIRSGLNIKFVDCSGNSFLMDLERMPKSSAWVLSELYGQTYDLLHRRSPRPFCILDMAMTIPEKQLLNRLGPSDLGLFSFGVGKLCFAGWGGIGVTQDHHLAQELRRMVQVTCREGLSRGHAIQRTLLLAARVMAHWGPLYGFGRKIRNMLQSPRTSGRPQQLPSKWSRDGSQGPEWRRLPLRPELRMVAYNFRTLAENAVFRRELEGRYRRLLQDLPQVVLPALSQGVMSHFTIRVSAPEREKIRKRLWRHGVDTGDLFGFPSYCDPVMFPNAFKASQELINLPMDPRLTTKCIQLMARLLGDDSRRSEGVPIIRGFP
jgi:hypothetical protein